MGDFESMKSFVDVPVTDSGVETGSFLEASDGLVDLFDLLGSAVFGFVQTDLRTNIAGVRERYEAHREASSTLEKFVLAEDAEGSKIARGCLIRLLRGLSFTLRALQTMRAEESLELHACFRQAYDHTLSHHHPFLVRKVVGVAIRAVPYRPDFYARISKSSREDIEAHKRLNEKLDPWLHSLENIVRRMKDWLEEKQFGKVTM